ncbi:hypothetical protein [Veillonella montpellierensis]|uniref:MuF-C-terminal domain-containing protein n=1 Tax=Veillonella montpellierensis TaxID=187328 RepID=UPI0023F779AD|nr:hypothetical protein [Veillonella montpellierensis]
MQVRVMTTPLALQLAGAKPYEVVMGVGKIRKIMKEHPEITKAGLKNLIQQLSDPIAVFESKTQKGSIIAMVQLKYPVNNANVIIPIKLDADSSRGTYKVNVITSTYAKYNMKSLSPSISWYKNKLEGKEEKALYLNAKKITDWYSVNRLQLPSTEYHISDFFTYTIPNEEDLRKLKEENPSYYQLQPSGVTKQQVVEAKEKLKADTEAWGTLIDAFKANKVTEYRHRVMSMPLVYQMIGMQNKELFIENNILSKVLNKKHANKYDLDVLKQLPTALADPIAVFENYDVTTGTVKADTFISVIGIKSKTGKLTSVPISFNLKTDGYFIVSIFPREKDLWYREQINNNHLLYVNCTKKDAITVSGKSISNITEMTSIDDSIPNEEDLRKLKEENTSYYQSQPAGVTKQQIVEAKAKLKTDTANWSKIIDNLDSYDAGMHVRVMTTPLALQLAGAKPYEVVMGVGKIRKIMKEHPEITKAGLKNLIQQLSDPIAVFESKTQKGSIIAMVQLKYPVNNANVIIPIKLDADSSRGTYKVNVITSTYAKYNMKSLSPSISWYKNKLEGKEEKALYLNAKKITDWYSVNRLQLPSTEYHISDFFTYTIPNEEDLRKLKEENSSYYQSVRGVTSMYDDGRKLVELFDSANFSTFVHESGHVFLEDLRMLANMEGAPREVVSDWEAIKTWTGYQEGADADTNRTAHERFAQGFEAYVRDGSAPTKSLQRAFRQFAKWLTKLYQKVSMLGGLPPKEIREVMDRMLATEQDIESWANEREVERLEANGHMQNLSEQEQARIEKGLVERHPIYRERARYEAFGI